jgi:hypothetical protein
VQITQAKPATIYRMLEVARLAELAMPRAALANPDSVISQQLAEMQTDMRRLMIKVDKAMVSNVRSRTPAPERRVRFEQPEPQDPSSAPLKNVFADRRIVTAVHRQQLPLSSVDDAEVSLQPATATSQQPVINNRTQRQPSQRSTEPCTRCARLHNKKQFFAPLVIPQKCAIFVVSQSTFRQLVFRPTVNADGVASQPPTMGSFRHEN